MQYQTSTQLRVGSWPGRDYHNPFVRNFCQSLVESRVSVIDVPDPRLVAASEIDVLHIHWPEKVFWEGGSFPRVIARLFGTLKALRRLKQSGVILVWTVHNLRPHDLAIRFKPLWTYYVSQLGELIDGFVTLSPATVDVVRQKIHWLRKTRAIYAWHPPYPREPMPADIDSVRRDLGIGHDEYLFGFLGMIRPYKGVEELIRAFREVQDYGYSLLIAGAPVPDEYALRIGELAAGDQRIHLVLRSLTDLEFSSFAAAANTLVLPFRDNLHSGSLVHAVSQHKTALTPETPFSRNLGETVGREWVQTYSSPLTPEVLLSAKPAKGLPSLDALDVSRSGTKLAEFYRSLIESKRVNAAKQLRVDTEEDFARPPAIGRTRK
jgi:glycosyltransferase involved in cell wall biosynthesis